MIKTKNIGAIVAVGGLLFIVQERALAKIVAGPYRESIKIDQSVIELEISGKQGAEERIKEWVRKSAIAVVGYYQKFPVKNVAIMITVEDNDRVGSGTTFGRNGAKIFVNVGQNASRQTLDDDWTMTHEMIHLALPHQGRSHQWLEEGLATYVEPVARARKKQLTPERVWFDMVKGMPQGLPEAGDRGLDHTHTWARTYWGGALFCLIADIEIRKQTDNRFGLEHALRAIQAKGGDITVRWPVMKTLTTADEATGKNVLVAQYKAWRANAVKPDLTQLWKDLGITFKGDSVTFDDKAPLAAIRRAILTATL